MAHRDERRRRLEEEAVEEQDEGGADEEEADDQGPVAYADGRASKKSESLWATGKDEDVELPDGFMGELTGEAEREVFY